MIHVIKIYDDDWLPSLPTLISLTTTVLPYLFIQLGFNILNPIFKAMTYLNM